MIWNETRELLAEMTAGAGENPIPDIVRLVEDPDVKKNVQLDEISRNYDAAAISAAGGEFIGTDKDTAGITYPVIRVNDYVFPARHVRKMSVSCTGFLPTVTVSLYSNDTDFISKSAPKDGDMLSLYMRTTTSALEYVRCDFIITSFTAKPIKSGTGDISTMSNISGVLFIPGFNATATNTYGFIGTSREVMRKIAEEFSIGFAFNDEEDTNDFQNWISCNRSIEAFVNEIVTHAWKDETSFFQAWIDPYYNINFVNVNRYFLSQQSNSEIDITFFTNTLINAQDAVNDPDAHKTSGLPKILTTMSEFRGTPLYIRSWRPVNNSTSISLGSGYSVETYTFMHNQNLLDSDFENCFSRLVNIPAYDMTKTDTHMLLRGRSKYERGKNPDGEQARVNYDFVNTYTKKVWTGVDYVMDPDEHGRSSNDGWSGNTHMNFRRSVWHNSINNREIDKMYIVAECDGLNLQVMRGEYVPVYFPFSSEAEREIINSDINIPGAAVGANKLYSGYYYVADVTYNFKYGVTDNGYSPFSTVYTLKRREWPTPEKIAKDTESNE